MPNTKNAEHLVRKRQVSILKSMVSLNQGSKRRGPNPLISQTGKGRSTPWSSDIVVSVLSNVYAAFSQMLLPFGLVDCSVDLSFARTISVSCPDDLIIFFSYMLFVVVLCHSNSISVRSISRW